MAERTEWKGQKDAKDSLKIVSNYNTEDKLHGKQDIYIVVEIDGVLQQQIKCENDYENDELHGTTINYVKGIKYVADNYENGLLHGEKHQFTDTGEKTNIYIYENHQVVSQEEAEAEAEAEEQTKE